MEALQQADDSATVGKLCARCQAGDLDYRFA